MGDGVGGDPGTGDPGVADGNGVPADGGIGSGIGSDDGGLGETEGTIGGTMSDSMGESSVTSGEMSGIQSDANQGVADSEGFGISAQGQDDGLFSMNNIANMALAVITSMNPALGIGLSLGKNAIQGNVGNMAATGITAGLSGLGVPGIIGSVIGNMSGNAINGNPVGQGVGQGVVSGIANGIAPGLGGVVGAIGNSSAIGNGTPGQGAGVASAGNGGVGSAAGNNTMGGDLAQILSQMYMGYQGNKAYGGAVSSLNNLYSPDSPYAQQMRSQLERKDAAAGRRSQYGPREAQLAGSLASNQANVMSSPGYANLMGKQQTNANSILGILLNQMGNKNSQFGQKLNGLADQGLGWLGNQFGGGQQQFSGIGTGGPQQDFSNVGQGFGNDFGSDPSAYGFG